MNNKFYTNDKMTVSVRGGNIFLVSALTIIFYILKIKEIIFWDWVWIVSPLWIDTLVMIIIYMIGLVAYNIIEIKNK